MKESTLSPTSELPIAIIGAGIGGLSAAITLRRAGHEVQVFEQAPHLHELGAGIGIRPRTAKTLSSWGLEEAYSKLTVRFWSVQNLDGKSGEPVGELVFPSETDDPAESWSDAIHRGDLHSLLASQVPDECMNLSRKCRSVVDHGDHVELEFVDGSSQKAAAVIAAEGIHSGVRQMIYGQPDAAVYSGLQGHRGVLPIERVKDLLPEKTPCSWHLWDTGSLFLVLPLRNGTHVSFDALFPVAQAGEESWRSVMARDVLVEKLAGFDPAVPEIVRRMEETEVPVFSLYDREPITQWTTNRITLLGDAAHPFLPSEGQGANQAVEDAVVLAECLSGVENDAIPAALQRYSDIRIPITSEIHRMSRERHAAFMEDSHEQ